MKDDERPWVGTPWPQTIYTSEDAPVVKRPKVLKVLKDSAGRSKGAIHIWLKHTDGSKNCKQSGVYYLKWCDVKCRKGTRHLKDPVEADKRCPKCHAKAWDAGVNPYTLQPVDAPLTDSAKPKANAAGLGGVGEGEQW